MRSRPEDTASDAGEAQRYINILALSDHVDQIIYNTQIAERFKQIDLILSCGDLPPYYLEFVVSMLNVPLYGVRGNHDYGGAYDQLPSECLVQGGDDLNCRAIVTHGLLIAGLAGSPSYNGKPLQYSELEMQLHIARLVPRLLLNRLRYGRYLDILVTHAPPRGIHDAPDRAHQGFAALKTFLRLFRPRYHLHGHIHIYDRQTITRTDVGETTVINAYGFRELRLPVIAPAHSRPQQAHKRLHS